LTSGQLVGLARMATGLTAASATPVPVTGLTVPIVGTGRPLWAIFTGRVAHNTAGQQVIVQIALNGTPIRRTEFTELVANQWFVGGLDVVIDPDILPIGDEATVTVLVSTPYGNGYVGGDALGTSDLKVVAL